MTHAFSEDPEGGLRFVAASKQAARRARPRHWVILSGLSAMIFASIPFYRMAESGSVRFGDQGFTVGGGFSGLVNPTAAALYWLIAVPILYCLVAVYIVISGNRSGVRTSVPRVVMWGSMLFVVVTTVTVAVPQLIPGPLASRGLLPVLTTSIGVAVWGLLDRDRWMAVVGAVAAAVGLISNLYNLENVLLAQGVEFDETWRLLPNIAAAGLVLLVGAVAVALRDRDRR